MRVRSFILCGLLAAALLSSGCARLHTKEKLDYRTVEPNPTGNSRKAMRKFERALPFVEVGDYARAEQCLQEALLADVSYGPAHNALGKVYYDQKKFYLAAWEFEHAVKTMPSRPEPLNNLGLVYESVEWLDEAVVHYQKALELAPEEAEYLGNLLRARIRRGESPATMLDDLKALVLLDDRQDWVDWAQKQIVFAQVECSSPTVMIEGDAAFSETSLFPNVPVVETDGTDWQAPETLPFEEGHNNDRAIWQAPFSLPLSDDSDK